MTRRHAMAIGYFPGVRKSYRHKCIICEAYYHSHKKEQKYCSTTCRGIGMRKQTWIVCEYCGKRFSLPKSHGYRRFCSRECVLNSRRKGNAKSKAIGDLILTLDNALTFEYTEKKCVTCGKILQQEDTDTCENCRL